MQVGGSKHMPTHLTKKLSDWALQVELLAAFSWQCKDGMALTSFGMG